MAFSAYLQRFKGSGWKGAVTFIRSLSLKATLWILSSSFLMATAISMGSSVLLLRLTTKKEPERPRLLALPTKNFYSGSQSLGPAEIDKIVKRNIFNSEGKVGDETENTEEDGSGQDQTAELVKTDLPLKLSGLIFGGQPNQGLATIENTAKKAVQSFLVGDLVMKGAKLAEVYPNRIILDRGGRREYLDMEVPELVRDSREKSRRKAQNTGGARLDDIAPVVSGPPPESYKEDGFERKDSNIQITESWRQNMLVDLAKVLQDAKAEPNVVDGQVHGFRLTRIREGSVYVKAGFQNNDIVEEINGVALKDASNAIKLLNQLKDSKEEIEVKLRRSDNSFYMKIKVK